MLRALDEVEEEGVEIEELVTDRHPSIVAHMRTRKDITHSIDIWHVAKGVNIYFFFQFELMSGNPEIFSSSTLHCYLYSSMSLRYTLGRFVF